MATTTTPVLGLIKPTPGTNEPIRVSDLNTNADKIEGASPRLWNVRANPYLAAGDGVADDRAAVLAAEAAMGAGGGVLFFPPGTYRFASSTTLLATTHVQLAPGAVLAPAAATVLTLRGSVAAGLWQIFQTGGGTITLARPQVVAPEWWGAKADVEHSTTGASISSGSTTLTLSWAALDASYVGKSVVVVGAGASGAPLVTTISSVTSGTVATLVATAGTTVSNGKAYLATDSTTAIQACLDQTANYVHRILLSGRYGATTVRLRAYTVLEGLSQLDFAGFYRVGVGSGGPFVSLNAAAPSAQGLRLENFYVECGFVGGTLDGIELGTAAAIQALAAGGTIRNVKVKNAAGWGFNVRCNVASFQNLWAQHDSTLPTGNTTAGGMRFIDTLAYGFQLNAEGTHPAGDFSLAAGGGSVYVGLQIEEHAAMAGVDAVTIGASNQRIEGVYWTGANVRDIVRVATTFARVEVLQVFASAAGSPTVTNVLNDVDRSYTLAGGTPLAGDTYLAGYTDEQGTGTNDVATSETTTSTSYVDLTTVGPSVSVAPGRPTIHLITPIAHAKNSVPGTNFSYVSVSVAGVAASSNDASYASSTLVAPIGRPILTGTLIASAATHRMKYRVDGGTGTYQDRRLIVQAVQPALR